MKIYSMTATFGNLEHRTLTLHPGLNIIHAPNEWGKSTWCAFLAAMLYGIDTRAKSTKTILADKERYAPWSGSPMEGSIDLNWNGRDITIQRRTKGRTPLGEFKAYETASGIPVPELTGANCGQVLLGVERNVFQRAGFIRLGDMPVTNDDALRRRLNALVSTGDDSSAGDRLAKELKDLRNRCRYNRTGLLPQAEAERAGLEGKCRSISDLEQQLENQRNRLAELDEWLVRLENHRQWLEYGAAKAQADRVAEAREIFEASGTRLAELKARCAGMPRPEDLRKNLTELERLENQLASLDGELRGALPEIEEVPVPPVFDGMTGREAIRQAMKDRAEYESLNKKSPLTIPGLLLLLAGAVAAIWFLIPGLVGLAGGIALVMLGLKQNGDRRKAAGAMERHYGSADPDGWVRQAEAYADALEAYAAALEKHRGVRDYYHRQKIRLEQELLALIGGRESAGCRRLWESALTAWETCAEAERDLARQSERLQTLQTLTKPVPMPEVPDNLAYSRQETEGMTVDAQNERQQLLGLIGQYQGRMDALGSKTEAQRQLERVNLRIGKLEQVYAALTIAQETLTQASEQLQRRFAPRISRRAQELMGRLTAGRYNRVQLGENLVLQAGARQEDTLHEVLWRSDGTVDQLYLALRLAVAEALCEDAPLILDDALARFDDVRTAAALEILSEMAEKKQIVLFTCRSREEKGAAM